MKKLLIPALGAAALLGAPQLASAQFMAPGQPGWTTSNRTLPPGSPGLSPSNIPTPSPFARTVQPPTFAPASPFIGQRGDLNRAEPEIVQPGERDETGRIGPTVDRQQARFTGERGPDGKLLPTYLPQQAQATQPQQSAPQQMQREQSPSQRPMQPTRRPGSGATDQSGQMNPPPMEGRRQAAPYRSINEREMSETAALNALSAEGYTNFGRIERVGNNWQTTAMRDGRQVTVSVDPRTGAIQQK